MIERRSELLDIIKRAEIELIELDRPRKVGRETYYDIIDSSINGKWIIPERIFIPKQYWGNEVTSRTICWARQEDY